MLRRSSLLKSSRGHKTAKFRHFNTGIAGGEQDLIQLRMAGSSWCRNWSPVRLRRGASTRHRATGVAVIIVTRTIGRGQQSRAHRGGLRHDGSGIALHIAGRGGTSHQERHTACDAEQ